MSGCPFPQDHAIKRCPLPQSCRAKVSIRTLLSPRCPWRSLVMACWCLPLLLGGCAEDRTQLPVEMVVSGKAELFVEAQGELRSTAATLLQVPGPQFASRQLTWMVPDGTRVKAGDVVARFSASQSELELTQAEIDVRRQLLARAGKQGELSTIGARLDAALAQVDTNLVIAERYADADLDMFARNEILDAVQDAEFLGVQRNFLTWKQGQSEARGAAEVAVIDSAKASAQSRVRQRDEDLKALELRAPNDGVFALESDWGGEKPQVGSSMWAGREFGSLPDPGKLEVTLAVPQLDAEGLTVGAEVELSPLGRSDLIIRTQLSQVSQAAQVRSRGDTSKFVTMRAPVPAEDAARLGLVPGAGVRARLYHARAQDVLSVPNVALIVDGQTTMVDVFRGDNVERVGVELGARGTARSVVQSGLVEGDLVLLIPDRKSEG